MPYRTAHTVVGKGRPTPRVATRLSDTRKENARQRKLINRQRRNLKVLTSVIINAQRAIEKGDVLRAVAIVSVPIKYPPAAAMECKHEWQSRWKLQCALCKEVRDE